MNAEPSPPPSDAAPPAGTADQAVAATPSGTSPTAVAWRLPVWLLTLGAGVVSGLIAWAAGEAASGLFRPESERVFPVNYKAMGGYQKQAALSMVEGEALRVADRKKAAARFGLLGLVLGVGLGLVGGLAGGSRWTAARGAIVGALAGAAAGAGLSWAAIPLFFRFQSPESGLGVLFMTHAAIFVAVGATSGLALGLGLGDRSAVGRALFGGLLGGFLGTIALETVISLAFPRRAPWSPSRPSGPRACSCTSSRRVASGSLPASPQENGSRGTQASSSSTGAAPSNRPLRVTGRIMPGAPQQGRRVWWIAAVVAVALAVGAGVGLRWWPGRVVNGLVAAGLSAYARGDWERSALLARRRLKQAPNDQEALRLAARTMARQDRDQTVITTYSRLELERMTAEDYFLLGRALSRTGQDDLALKSLEAVRDADPDRLETLDELAQVYFRKDRPAAAEVLVRRLLGKPGREARRN